jgi:hypothetical protein
MPDGACDCYGNIDLGCGCGENGPSGCNNVCGSTFEYDDCGVCNGDNSTCADCCGIPDGDGTTCDGICGPCYSDIPNGACDCAGNVLDCNGECGGLNIIDECGICGGSGIPDGECDCYGNVEDVCGDCGGATTDFYECGISKWRIQVQAEIDSYDQFQLGPVFSMWGLQLLHLALHKLQSKFHYLFHNLFGCYNQMNYMLH